MTLAGKKAEGRDRQPAEDERRRRLDEGGAGEAGELGGRVAGGEPVGEPDRRAREGEQATRCR